MRSINKNVVGWPRGAKSAAVSKEGRKKYKSRTNDINFYENQPTNRQTINEWRYFMTGSVRYTL